MNSLNVHRVERINVRVRDMQTSDGEPYKIIKIKFVSKEYGDIEVSAFGNNEESIVITYGDE